MHQSSCTVHSEVTAFKLGFDCTRYLKVNKQAEANSKVLFPKCMAVLFALLSLLVAESGINIGLGVGDKYRPQFWCLCQGIVLAEPPEEKSQETEERLRKLCRTTKDSWECG